ncbi:hypothetical protein BKA67DRAFT_543008 [Truncatella angustata]|uniref:Secreted protein n=1 Tax=Truncatella angustata TaxID=152316 RepID=A0A9P8UTN4_9PEZI|nr:uncharacterized protein BKA67DRAFT_543008 [Truncatella angustata]KAH6658944.1 hypothetical protein BKA67DRAFT_543008 [Truncatella angustata]
MPLKNKLAMQLKLANILSLSALASNVLGAVLPGHPPKHELDKHGCSLGTWAMQNCGWLAMASNAMPGYRRIQHRCGLSASSDLSIWCQ